MGRRTSWAWPTVLGGAALLTRDAHGCAVCLGWTEGQVLTGGFYWSALLLTLLPFAVVAAIGTWIGLTLRRSSKDRARLG